MQNDNMLFEQIELGPMQNYVYILCAKDSDCAAVVDPGWEADVIADRLAKLGLSLGAILLTHGHYDHVTSVEDLLARGDVPVYVGEHEKTLLGDTAFVPRYTGDGELISAAGLDIKCIHTPGHSPGSQCFLVGGRLLTGDTLFVDHCGRMDLPGGSPAQMFESIQKIMALPDDTVVYPGHRYNRLVCDSLGGQKKTNPFMRMSREDFMAI